jgi:dihydrofolate reductase
MTALFASDYCGGMGFNGSMMWPHLSHDMKNFKKLTTGKNVLMGRKTWDSPMTTPLPNRTNIVVTSRHDIPNVITVSGMPAAILHELQENNINLNDTYVIGGAEILIMFLFYCDTVVHTSIDGYWEADTRIENSSWTTKFYMIDSNDYTEHGINYKISTWVKIT